MKFKIIKLFDSCMAGSVYAIIYCLPFFKAGIEIFTGLAIIFWLLKRLLGFKADGSLAIFPSTGLNLALAIFFVINFISVAISVDVPQSVKGFFGKFLEHFLLFFIVVEVIKNRERLRRVLLVFVLSAILMVIDSGVQYFTGSALLREFPMEGAYLTASFSSHNGFGGWLVIMIPLVAGLVFCEKKGLLIKVFLTVLCLMLLICLFLTYSRGSWIGLLLASVLFLFYWSAKSPNFSQRLLLGLIICFFFFIVIWMLPGIIKGRLLSSFDMGDASAVARINTWTEAFRIIKDFFLTGAGINTYSRIVLQYQISEGGGTYPHNSYLQMAAEIGFAGLTCFIWVLVSFFRMMSAAFEKNKDALLTGLVIGISAFLFQAVLDTNLYALQSANLFWLILGLSVSTAGLLKKEERIPHV